MSKRVDLEDLNEILPTVKTVLSTVKTFKISYSGLFKYVSSEVFKRLNLKGFTIYSDDTVNTNELKCMQYAILSSLTKSQINQIRFGDDSNSVLRNKFIRWDKPKLLGDYYHWINNPCDVEKYRISGYSIDWRGRQYCRSNIFDYQGFKPLRAIKSMGLAKEFDMRASGIRILGCLLRDSGLALDLIDPKKGDYYHNTNIVFADGEILKYGLMEYIYGYGRSHTGRYVSEFRETPTELGYEIPGDWDLVESVLRDTISKFNRNNKEVFYKLPDGFVVDFKKYHTITFDLTENWNRNSNYSDLTVKKLENSNVNIYSITIPGYYRDKDNWWMKGVTANLIHSWDAWILRKVFNKFKDNWIGSIHDCYILRDTTFEEINSYVSELLAWIYKNADTLIKEINDSFGTNIEPKKYDEEIYQKILKSESVKEETQEISDKINSDTYYKYKELYLKYIRGYYEIIMTGKIKSKSRLTSFKSAYKKLGGSNQMVDEYLKTPDESIYDNSIADDVLDGTFTVDPVKFETVE